MMRKFAVALALGSTALAGPALAKDNSFYVGLEGGGIISQAETFNLTAVNGTVTSAPLRANYKVGYDVDGILGYDFGMFRGEFEVGYKNNNVDYFQVNGGTPPLILANGGAGVPGTGNYNTPSGNQSVLSFMANGLVDFGGKGRSVGGYLGGGVGVARVKQETYAFVHPTPSFLDDSDTHFAWQLLAGVYKPVSEHVDISLKYRFFNVDKINTIGVNGVGFQTRDRSHSLLVGLTYNFGNDAPPPPPPVVVPPAPTPPPPLPLCPPAAVTPGPFLVFFDWDRSVITPEAAAILDRAADQYASTGQTSVTLAGHADKSGKPDYNVALSQRRADAVKDYMTKKGVAPGVITTEAFGESRPLVDTADGVREPQNRRVEITFGGAPAPASNGPCRPQ
jgi:outer membrane protein OmpA-like peptidoglycan-associated protein/opacity protein-like surface antigen